MGKRLKILKIIIPTGLALFGISVIFLYVNKKIELNESGLYLAEQLISETRINENTETYVSGDFEYVSGDVILMSNLEFEVDSEDRESYDRNGLIGTNVNNIVSNAETTIGISATGLPGTDYSLNNSVTGGQSSSTTGTENNINNVGTSEQIETVDTNNTNVNSIIVETNGDNTLDNQADESDADGLFVAETENINISSDMITRAEETDVDITVSTVLIIAESIPHPPPPFPLPPPEKMELLGGGSFYMGSPTAEEERDEDEVQHQVTVKPFYIGKYEVTQLEYQEVMGKNPSYFKGPNLPVESVSWFDAIEYCNKLSLKHNLTPAYKITGNVNNRAIYWDKDANGYRLPTEEEWEYACRARTTTPFNTGKNITRNRANYFGQGTVNVGIYPPNAWGLYDMHGNVAEWCWNKYQGYGYTQLESQMNSMDHRVIRGGSWLTMTMRMRSAFRDHTDPLHKNQSIGFRIARNE